MAFSFSKILSSFKSGAKEEDTAIVGVDIGSSTIKVVQVHDNDGVATLDTYGELQLGPYGGVEIGRMVNLAEPKLTEALVDIVRESGVSGKKIALAISYNASFITMLSMPTKDPSDIGSRIPVEARKYVPVSLSEVTLDWFPLPGNPDATGTTILLAAIYNEALTRYRSVVSKASLTTQFTEIELFSSIRSSVEQSDATVAVVDLGARAAKVYIAGKGVVQKAHVLRMGGSDLTEALAKEFSVTFEAAEETKRVQGLEGANEAAQKVLRTNLERGLKEVHMVLARYEEETGDTVGKIILSGSGALLTGLIPYAQDVLQRQVVLGDPFSKVAYPAFLEDTLKDAGPSFAVAIGAALRGLPTRR